MQIDEKCLWNSNKPWPPPCYTPAVVVDPRRKDLINEMNKRYVAWVNGKIIPETITQSMTAPSWEYSQASEPFMQKEQTLKQLQHDEIQNVLGSLKPDIQCGN